MLKNKRKDGSPIRGLPAFTGIMPYLMPDKAGSVIFYPEDYDITDTLAYIKEWNRDNARGERVLLTLFEVVLCATARTICLRPRINRFIAGKKYYQRNRVLLSFVAKKELTDAGKEVNVKIPFRPEETLATTARKVRDYIRDCTSDDGEDNEKVVDTMMKFPGPFLRFFNFAYNWLDNHNLLPYSVTQSDPMWSSVFLANIGSFGLDAPFHHLFERGTCPIFMAVGKVRAVNRLSKGPDGSPRVEERRMLRVNYSFDDRIADGIYMGRSLELIKRFIENPALLAEPENIPPEILAELSLAP